MTQADRPPLPPLEKSIRVAWPVEKAFRRFTEEIGSWWPLHTHSLGQKEAETVVMEGRVGGRILEKIRGAADAHWGTVTAWDPPRRVAFTWHPGNPPDTGQVVDVSFTSEGAGTRLKLTHGGWEKFGAVAAKARRGYDIGWGYVLAHWAERRSSFLVRFIDASTWLLRPFQKRMAEKAKAELEKSRALRSALLVLLLVGSSCPAADVAYERGTYQFTVNTPSGEWKVAADMANSDRPAAP